MGCLMLDNSAQQVPRARERLARWPVSSGSRNTRPSSTARRTARCTRASPRRARPQSTLHELSTASSPSSSLRAVGSAP
eukprot:CAMPEP_0182816168 /NCGR_PEP_ID=MMETSP0006_2-20121128/10794_1 /TAXON_ID=97485 /ORGANISM="Prymnesium parvum, Strain Texoma1" /LENGTH=78 /DNA_ID=CAMNT_0024942443 /DNA_START=207 /DNA_END=439 /DNA_ORIENTATION=+